MEPGSKCAGLAAGALAAVAALLAGCGGGGDGPAETATEPAGGTATTTAAEPPESPASFLAAADGLCADAQAEQERIRRERGGRQITLRDRARLLVDLAPARIELGEQLRALGLPERAAERRTARRLVATAARRGEASAEAGRKSERGGGRDAIAAAAAAEHDERLRFVALARRLGLGACAERLSAVEREAIEVTIARAFTAPDPARRCRAFGERYLIQEYGGAVRACARAQGDAGVEPASRVSVRDLQGIDGVFAVARAGVAGGSAAGEYRLRITFEDGDYRIDKLD